LRWPASLVKPGMLRSCLDRFRGVSDKDRVTRWLKKKLDRLAPGLALDQRESSRPSNGDESRSLLPTLAQDDLALVGSSWNSGRVSPENPRVGGSIPSQATKVFNKLEMAEAREPSLASLDRMLVLDASRWREQTWATRISIPRSFVRYDGRRTTQLRPAEFTAGVQLWELGSKRFPAKPSVIGSIRPSRSAGSS
jgi:hypothetical protein